MPKVFLEYLLLETYSSCNMRCGHCMKDEPQDSRMSKETLNNLKGQVARVDVLCLMGGETFLKPDVFEDAAEIFEQEDGPELGWWSVVTNLTVWNDAVKNSLRRLNHATFRFNKEGTAHGDISVSNTKWHRKARKKVITRKAFRENKKLLKASAEYIGVAAIDFNYMKRLRMIYDMGRAKKLKCKKEPRKCSRPDFHYHLSPNGDMLVSGDIYITVDGYVCSVNGNMEIDEMKKNAWGNINEEPLFDILKRAKDTIICPVAVKLEKLDFGGR